MNEKFSGCSQDATRAQQRPPIFQRPSAGDRERDRHTPGEHQLRQRGPGDRPRLHQRNGPPIFQGTPAAAPAGTTAAGPQQVRTGTQDRQRPAYRTRQASAAGLDRGTVRETLRRLHSAGPAPAAGPDDQRQDQRPGTSDRRRRDRQQQRKRDGKRGKRPEKGRERDRGRVDRGPGNGSGLHFFQDRAGNGPQGVSGDGPDFCGAGIGGPLRRAGEKNPVPHNPDLQPQFEFGIWIWILVDKLWITLPPYPYPIVIIGICFSLLTEISIESELVY